MILKANPFRLKAIDDKALFPPHQLFPLHPFVSLHPHTSSRWLPQTCVIHYTPPAPLPFLSSAQVFEVSRSSDHLTYFIKNTWDAIWTACSSSSRRSDGSARSSDTSHPSSSPTGRSYRVSLIYARSHSHVHLLESEAYAARKPSRQRGALKEQIRILAGK